jgi:hypothetical protein
MESVRLFARRSHLFDYLFMCSSEELIDDWVVQNKQVKHVLEALDHAFIAVGISYFSLKCMEVKMLVTWVFDMLVVDQDCSSDHKSSV